MMSHINPSIKSRLESDRWSIKPLAYYLGGILEKKDYYILSEAITLLESSVQAHQDIALQLLQKCYHRRTEGVRIGITGSPGVGKSTFINSLAGHFISENGRVGILTIDPSSTDKKGSILGDKTRMNELIQDKSVFIRPSPTSTYLGGINEHTYEAIILCEAAGMDHIFIETVGVGQSEMAVSDHTDLTILLGLPGGGDSLQGIKKGIVERADLIIINKADGDREALAKQSCRDLREAVHITQAKKNIPVLAYSAISGYNKEKVILQIKEAIESRSPEIMARRRDQELTWLDKSVEEFIRRKVHDQLEEINWKDERIDKELPDSPFDTFARLKNQLSISISLKKED